jgi:hypothetical protein
VTNAEDRKESSWVLLDAEHKALLADAIEESDRDRRASATFRAVKQILSDLCIFKPLRKPRRELKTIREWYYLGDRLSDGEVRYLFERYSRIEAAVQGFPEYEATRFHATHQTIRLRDVLRGRGLLQEGE